MGILNGISEFLEAKAEEKRVLTRIQEECFNAEKIYGTYAYIIFCALNSISSQAVIKPLDISEVALPSTTRTPKNFAFNVNFATEEDSKAAHTAVRMAVLKALAKEFRVNAREVNKALDIKVAGSNILITWR